MNKPIIIDGVDVSECCFLSKDKNCQLILTKCQDLCYYKQLQRLKAENEKLKKEVSDLNFYIDSYKITWEIDKCNKYKHALEEIQNVLFPKNKLLITDSKGLLKTQEILNEVLK
jgi:hypothetical protein